MIFPAGVEESERALHAEFSKSFQAPFFRSQMLLGKLQSTNTYEHKHSSNGTKSTPLKLQIHSLYFLLICLNVMKTPTATPCHRKNNVPHVSRAQLKCRSSAHVCSLEHLPKNRKRLEIPRVQQYVTTTLSTKLKAAQRTQICSGTTT